jgi:hypothetical protein
MAEKQQFRTESSDLTPSAELNKVSRVAENEIANATRTREQLEKGSGKRI